MIEDFEAYKKRLEAQVDHSANRFMLDEGLDLISHFRLIQCVESRAAVVALVKAMVEGERKAEDHGKQNA